MTLDDIEIRLGMLYNRAKSLSQDYDRHWRDIDKCIEATDWALVTIQQIRDGRIKQNEINWDYLLRLANSHFELVERVESQIDHWGVK